MILKNLHTENKPVQTQLLFEPSESKVLSMQIAKGETLKEHVSKVPALLVCVSGNAVYTDEKEIVINLSSGVYVMIQENIKHAVKAIEESNFLLVK
ncbi:cupin domain-containing protein [Flavobacterium xueshanense]|uniref:Cupin domain-containing protein n=1 Tax=Flavobacterium xueshanense TaxID=935223 RepID=A0A1I2FBD6_9FLAO|nr:hypothetical protein [Flavobacterium xueshanense]SFF02333.1 hypothetical protein SAMN04488131_10797 [Flavobacterium xueshanense]